MMANRVRRVVRQTRARVLEGITQFPDKLLSLFETHTEVIRKGKAAKPNEFGNVVELQEAENQIITHYEVFEKRTSDQRLLLPAIEAHQRKLGEFQDGLPPTLDFILERMKKRPKPWE
jgi:IS5 family transposase